MGQVGTLNHLNVNAPLRVPPPRQTPSTAPTPAPFVSPVPTVPILSVCECSEPIGTPIFRRPSLPGYTLTSPTKDDAHDDVDGLESADCVA